MSVLSIENLTMKFGGITAVNDLSLDVQKNQIYSIIGPNGAGKTTVFNAVTGIYQPTSGRVTFEENDVRRPFSIRVILGCLLAGLIFGLLSYLAAAGVEELWKASITRQFSAPEDRFDFGKLATAAHDYLSGKPGVEHNRTSDKWEVKTLDGKTVIGVYKEETEARNARDDLFKPLPADADPNTAALQQRLVSERDSLLRNTRIFLLAGLVLAPLAYLLIWHRSRRTPDVIAHGGIARTFQNIRLFSAMTVMENVLVGMDRKLSTHPILMALGHPNHRKEEQTANGQALKWLKFVGLQSKAKELAKNLAYGDQRRLEIARALAAEPKLLLLDEPAAGMNPSESTDLMALIKKIRDLGITVLLIEHHMNIVMGISDRVAVLDYGVKIAEGPPAEVARDPKVIAAYLGTEEVS